MTFTAAGTGAGEYGASTISLTTHTVGDLVLVVVLNISNATVSCTGVSSSNATWTPLTSSFAGTTQAATGRAFIGKVTAASAATLTASWSGTAPSGILIAYQEFSSSNGFSAVSLDTSGHVDSSGTNNWASLTPANAAELYFGYCWCTTGYSSAGTSGYTYVADGQGDAFAYRLSCPAGTATFPAFTDGAEAFGIMVLVTDAAAAGNPGPVVVRAPAQVPAGPPARQNVSRVIMAPGTVVIPETSPGLELSGFGSFSELSGSVINSVTVTVTEHQSDASQAPCTFELWDYSGTPAQIGATQTGNQSTGTGNVSTAVFTGITYAQLATLRVRVYGHAPSGSGFTESVDAVQLTVSYTPPAGGSGPSAGSDSVSAAEPVTQRIGVGPPLTARAWVS